MKKEKNVHFNVKPLNRVELIDFVFQGLFGEAIYL